MNNQKLGLADPQVAAAIGEELGRQRHKIELIASENFVSPAVMEAMGTVLTNKYAEASTTTAPTIPTMAPPTWRSSRTPTAPWTTTSPCGRI